MNQLESVRLPHVQVRQFQRADNHLFDRIIGQDFIAECGKLFGCQIG